MIDFTALFIVTIATVGLVALFSTDPVAIEKAAVPTLIAAQGYHGDLIEKLLRERIRTIARTARTARGDDLSVFNRDASAIDILTERLQIDEIIDVLRNFLHLNEYSLAPYLIYAPSGIEFNYKTLAPTQQIISAANALKFGLKGETTTGELFYLNVNGSEEIPSLIQKLAELFVEQVDPYVLTLYYFRQEYPGGNFTNTLPLIEHSVRVLPAKRKMWPILLWGQVHYRLGHYDDAIQKYQEVLQLVPTYTEALALWGEALIAQGHIAAGLAKMSLAVLKAADDPTLPHQLGNPTPHEILGNFLAQHGADNLAREIYLKGLIYTPQNPFLKTSLGALYLRHGQKQPALDLLQEALLTHPNPAHTRALLDQALLLHSH